MQVIQGVQRTGVPERADGVAQYGFADNGTLAYIAGTGDSRRMGTLVLVDRAGNADSLTDEQRRYFRPRMSPDGARVAVEVSEPGSANEATHIWVVAAESDVATQLTFEGMQNQFPVWAPDGQTVIFASDRADGMGEVYKARDCSPHRRSASHPAQVANHFIRGGPRLGREGVANLPGVVGIESKQHVPWDLHREVSSGRAAQHPGRKDRKLAGGIGLYPSFPKGVST